MEQGEHPEQPGQPQPGQQPQPSQAERQPWKQPARVLYWRRQLRRTVILLSVWAATAFGCSIFFAETLNRVEFLGVPFGFWMAQQGSIIIFVLLILLYAVLSGRADRRAGLGKVR